MTYLLCCTSFGSSNTDTQDSIGTELSLVGGTVELEQEVVHCLLIGDVDTSLDQLWSNDLIDVVDRLGDTFGSVSKEVEVSMRMSCGTSDERRARDRGD